MPTLEERFARFARHGDLEALEAVFDATAQQLLAAAGYVASSEAAAEDLVQSTFVAVIEQARAFDPSRPLLPWLAGILAKKAKKAKRQARRAPPPLSERVEPHPVEPMLSAELRLAVQHALARIDALHREPLRLRLVEGCQPLEIAQRLQRSAGAVRVQLHRGVEMLRRLLPPGLALGTGALVSSRGLAAIKGEVLAHASARVATATLGAFCSGAWS